MLAFTGHYRVHFPYFNNYIRRHSNKEAPSQGVLRLTLQYVYTKMSQLNRSQDERLVTIALPVDIIEWIDGIAEQLGLNNRGTVVAAMLRELKPEIDHDQDAGCD